MEPVEAMQPATELLTVTLARGRAIKWTNAFAATLCGGVPAAALAVLDWQGSFKWSLGFLLGLFWANLFEYLYHRYLLHIPGKFFADRHLMHHSSVGTIEEPLHINFGGSPVWIALLFAVNGIPLVAADLALGWGVSSGALFAFTLYFLALEEVHWRVHVGGKLPGALERARAYHIAHHDYPNARYNVFLPISDWIFGSTRRI